MFTALLAVAGTVLCLRIPKWVESTAGEVPAALRATRRGRRTPMGRGVVVALWGNGAIRVLTGFLTLFVAFVVKQTDAEPTQQLLLIGIVGAAAGVGVVRAATRRARGRGRCPAWSCCGAWARRSWWRSLAAALPGIATAAVVGLVGAAASALAKVSLDAVIQRDLPEESRASAFGRSETVLQLAWVMGGALGVLLPHDTFWIGFTVVACVVALVGVQTVLLYHGRSIAPFLAVKDRPVAPTGAREPVLIGSIGWSGASRRPPVRPGGVARRVRRRRRPARGDVRGGRGERRREAHAVLRPAAAELSERRERPRAARGARGHGAQGDRAERDLVDAVAGGVHLPQRERQPDRRPQPGARARPAPRLHPAAARRDRRARHRRRCSSTARRRRPTRRPARSSSRSAPAGCSTPTG